MAATPEFRRAAPAEAAEIADLVNSAYRGEPSRAGWTTEADLLEGRRTEEAEIRRLIVTEGSIILVAIAEGEIIASVHLRREDDGGAYLGLLVVKPVLQGAGIGKAFMQAAEDFVRAEWGAPRMTMTVISLRAELIAFYERRGYRRTGRLLPFPEDPGLSVALVENMMFEVLEKDLAKPD